MPLILNDLTPLHWAVAGGVIAVVTLCLLFVANRRLGISSAFEDICSLVLDQSLSSGCRVQRPRMAPAVPGGTAAWRVCVGGAWRRLASDLGAWHVRRENRLRSLGKLAWMFVGGAFIGFGTRLANGCTSGHGIFGMSNFELELRCHAHFHDQWNPDDAAQHA